MSAINTSFLIMSDTHGLDIHENTAHDFRLPLPNIDVLLHCGDLTQVGGHGASRNALKMLREIDAELKLVIAGNHDLELDKDYWLTHLDEEDGDESEEHDQAIAIMRGPLAKQAGVTYLEEGAHTFTLSNGASFSIFVSAYSPAFGDWAFAAVPSEDRFANLQDRFDILMTHGPPKNILDTSQGNVGCEHTLNALRCSKPMLYCFSHIHAGYGAQTVIWNDKTTNTDIVTVKPANIEKADRWNIVYKVKDSGETLAINAPIQDENGAFCNAPWLVRLPLHNAN
ncbi:Metallo-dependent phosphatase, partial [Aureobasidium melanogenum]